MISRWGLSLKRLESASLRYAVACEFERESDTGIAGRRISPRILFKLFNAVIMEELKQHRAFKNKIVVKSTED